MNNKFRVSKYKNLVPNQPDISKQISSSLSLNDLPIYSNLISSSGYLYAFLADNGQIKICSCFPNQSSSNNILQTISNVSSVSDFEFSPFHDDTLLVSSNVGTVQLFRIPISPNSDETISVLENGAKTLIDSYTLQNGGSVKSVKFHPTVDYLFACSNGDRAEYISLYDLNAQNRDVPLCSVEHTCSSLKSFCFDYYGKTVALNGTCEDGTKRSLISSIHDLRSSTDVSIGHVNHEDILPNTDSRVMFVDGPSSMPYILSSYINKYKYRTVSLYDLRNLSNTPLCTSVDVTPVSNPLNIFVPHFDADTGLCFFNIRNGNYLVHQEINETFKTQNFNVSTCADNGTSIPHTIKGSVLASKRCLNVMNTEIDRLLLLTGSGVYPLSYSIPRKSYYEFHSDLYPKTKAPYSSLVYNDLSKLSINYFHNQNQSFIQTLSLDPMQTKFVDRFSFYGKPKSDITETKDDPNVDKDTKEKLVEETNVTQSESSTNVVSEANNSKPSLLPKPSSNENLKKFTISAKCKYLKGNLLNRDTHLTNVKNICKNISPTCDGFKANVEYGFFPVGSNCNQLAVVRLDRQPGCGYRMSGAVLPHILCCDLISDFCLDPFDLKRVAIGLQSGTIQIFSIGQIDLSNLRENEEDSNQIVEQSDMKLIGHVGRVTFVHFHPLAKNVLASSGSGDNSILLWNLDSQSIQQRVQFQSPILAFSLNNFQSGAIYAGVVCKNQDVMIVDLVQNRTKSDSPQISQQGKLPYKMNNTRLTWILEDHMLLITGFNGLSERQFYLYDVLNMSSGPLQEYGLDVSPSILVPHFDEDTRTLFLTARGDSLVYTFEISHPSAAPNLVIPLSHFEAPTPHQAVSFLPKLCCNVSKLEFALGYRLTSNSIEPFNFVIPRIHLEYFHDDLFPPTRNLSKPLFSAGQWFEADFETLANTAIPMVSLKPDGMENFSQVKERLLEERQRQHQRQNRQENADSSTGNVFQSMMEESTFMHNFSEMIRFGKEKQELLMQQISGRVEFNSSNTTPLEQVEGVDSDEWEDDD